MNTEVTSDERGTSESRREVDLPVTRPGCRGSAYPGPHPGLYRSASTTEEPPMSTHCPPATGEAR